MKNKIASILLCITVSLSMVVMLSACESESVDELDADLIGYWVGVKSVDTSTLEKYDLTFAEDGGVTMQGTLVSDEEISGDDELWPLKTGTYTAKDGVITFYFDGEDPQTHDYRIVRDKLLFDEETDDSQVYSRGTEEDSTEEDSVDV